MSTMVGKTATIKKRQVNVYLPTEELKAKWNAYARGKNTKLSRLIFEVVEAAIAEDEDPDAVDKGALIKEVNELRLANTQLAHDLRMEKELTRRFDEELEGYRRQGFLTPGFGGVRDLDDRGLVPVLRESSPIQDDALFRRLGIDPTDPKSADAMRAVNEQLASLQRIRAVKSTRRGWAWLG